MQIILDDGRRLGYAEYGDPAGSPLLYFHGLPSSRLEAALCEEAGRRLGIRILAVDRPGYGLSDFQPGRRLTDWPDDVSTLAEGLGIGRFAVLGVSGGGPYALACAWKIPEKLSAVTVVGGLAPLDQPETLRAMHWDARLAFELARRSYILLWLAYGVTMGGAIRMLPSVGYQWQRLSGSAADRAALARERVKRIMLAALRESVRQGVRGPLWDVVLYAQAWGFRLEDIGIPVTLWHGMADRLVPLAHARVVASALPHARLHVVEGGHFSLPVDHTEAILGGQVG
jgi:pimeloyl-ACP methyl ester carboxylesterase